MAAISVVLLLGAALAVPSMSAYATHDNGKGKTNLSGQHQKDRRDKIEDQKEEKKQDKCEDKFGKYGKICEKLDKHEDKHEGKRK